MREGNAEAVASEQVSSRSTGRRRAGVPPEARARSCFESVTRTELVPAVVLGVRVHVLDLVRVREPVGARRFK